MKSEINIDIIEKIYDIAMYLPEDCIARSLPGSPLIGRERFSKIYHTTSLNSFMLIWAKKRMKFAPLTGVNDMKEINLSISAESPQRLPMLFAMQDVRKAYKQISFTMDFDSAIKGYASPLIWGVYGDKNNGVCIELDYNKLNLPINSFHGIVEYENRTKHQIEIPKDVVTVNSLKSFIRAHQKELFFVKDKCWEYENEYRIISDADEYLDITDAITSVYVAELDGLTFEIVDELLKDTNVKFGYVHVDRDSGVLFSSDARKYKESVNSALNNPNNCLLPISEQAKNYYESLKNNPDADLTKIEYNLCHD